MTTAEAQKLAEAQLAEASALVAQATALGRKHRLDLVFAFEGGKDSDGDEVTISFHMDHAYLDYDEIACWDAGGWVGSSYRC